MEDYIEESQAVIEEDDFQEAYDHDKLNYEYGLLVENYTTQLIQADYDSEGNLLFRPLAKTNFDMTMNKQIPRIPEVYGFNPTFVIKLEE